MKIGKINTYDYILANKIANRDMFLTDNYSKNICGKIHESKKIYNRKKVNRIEIE